jgi:D-alanyl-D-alanine carboxypeptidase
MIMKTKGIKKIRMLFKEENTMFHHQNWFYRCMLITSLLASLILNGISCASPTGSKDKIGNQLQAILDAAVAKPDAGYPGALLYVRSANVIWQKSSGLGEISTQTMMRADDKFRAGSILKMFVAAVTLQLVEEERFSLDATLPNVLPANIAAKFQDDERITVRMLLNHTSGLPEALTDEVIAQIGADPTKVWTAEEWLDLAAEQSQAFAPGEGWMYSNTNYILLGMVIENATGNSWRSEIRQRVIGRLGLTNTFLPEPGDLSIPGNYAHGYIDGGIDITSVDPSMMDAAGGSALVMTASDLARFLNSLLAGQLFQNSNTSHMLLTFVDAQDESGLPYGYGLGLQRYQYEGSEMIGHGGATAGFASCVFVFPGENLTIAAMINAEEMMNVYTDIVIPAFNTLKGAD